MKIKNAPSQPGVYRMLGEDGGVLYVGKAKDIKKRIVSYSHIDKLPFRLQKMVSEIRNMEFIVVENESKALLLENELIKELEPKYNILLKDDKTFPHLVINMEEDYPSLRKYHGKRNDKSKYFGPFASVWAVNNALNIIQKAFLLRSCRDSMFNNRTRPCMLYQIKRCSAPCVNKISQEDYMNLAQEAVAFLEGKNSKIQQELSQEMNLASEGLDYEKALVLRDRIKALTNIQQGQNIEYAEINSADFIALARRGDMVCIQVFFIRSGQNCGNVPYFPKQIKDVEDDEILEAFLSSFYTKHIPPKEIVISHELENKSFIEDAISTKIHTYKKGNKAKLLSFATKNAEEALSRKIAEEASVKNNLNEFVKVFGLDSEPRRIEIYDNSHIQGSYAIGAMVVATPDGFDKKQYRTFNIKNQEITNDDFAMMKEVLGRRFDKMTEENRPDVMIIDGGLGQLHAVHEALKDYDLSKIKIIAMSKGVDRNAGKEMYHLMGQESFSLPFQSPIAFYLQNLRDEAHRFAIGTHRKKRGKSMFKSKIDEIEGIGAKRKKDLLNHFGSVEQIEQASLSDLEKVSGVSKKIAEKIYNYFHN
ncbi:MAG: excinuclease ABC subunit UvrC [Alphaproteobacteria bacterium]